jgi:hypothetical protein
VTRPLKVDQVARSIPNRAAVIASGMGDENEALELARDLHLVLEDSYELRLRTGVPERRETETNGAVFIGRPMQSRFASRCAVCSGQIAEGSDILYSSDRKRAAHLNCGEVQA